MLADLCVYIYIYIHICVCVYIYVSIYIYIYIYIRYGSVRLTFGGFSTGYSTWYLVLFLVPPWLRFQANCTITKTWRVNSADHWLAEENRHCLRHWTCGMRRNRPAILNQHSQWRIERNCFEWAHLYFNNQKMAVSLFVEEVQTVLSLIAEERISECLMERRRIKKFFRSHGSRGGVTITTHEWSRPL